MDVIPVIDLMGGVVVHARGGARAEYRPIETPLAASSAPSEVVAGLLRLAPFRSLYVADLDAIEGRGDHGAVLQALQAAHPGVDFWVDSGIAGRDAAVSWRARFAGSLVIGSEAQTDGTLLDAMAGDPRVVLSLDFRGETFLGPPALLAEASRWPGRVIVMTLARVGADAGPDLARLALLQARAAGRALYAAGGVRDSADLEALAAAGAAGVLVASALHRGAIGAADLRRFASAGPAG